MRQFPQGFINYNHPSAQHEGMVYTRRLGLQLADGTVIDFFDSTFPISQDLAVGTWCTVLLSLLLPYDLRYLPAPGRSAPDGWWRGTLVDLDWHPTPSLSFNFTHEGFFQTRWVIIDTAVGEMLISYHALDTHLGNQGIVAMRVGDLLQWQPTRFDLEAIVPHPS